MNMRYFRQKLLIVFLVCFVLLLIFVRPWEGKLSSMFMASIPSVSNPSSLGNSGIKDTPSSHSAFITRTQSTLLLNGAPFRFSGANIYWLGLLETSNGGSYPSKFQVDDALATANLMGASVIRSHTLGISVGCKLCLEPDLNIFNPTAFMHIDYAIQSAARHHLRLIIPLTDNYHYYHGGKHTFTDWHNIAYEGAFYSDSLVIGDFQRYVKTLLNHVNSYTGIAYKNDPTILAWETGNELSAPSSWVQMMANFIKNADHHHLVMDGNSEGTKETTNFLPDLAISSIDLYTSHYYPPSIDDLSYELAQVQQMHKVFIIGEYDWNTTTGDSLQSFFSVIERSGVVGDMYWSLFGHNDGYGFVQHNEHYTLHYPGATPSQQFRINLIRQHAYAMQGVVSLPTLPRPIAPVVTSLYGHLLIWRGIVGAENYSIERSTTGPSGPWTLICHRCVTDTSTPWLDKTRPTHPVWYRMKAFSESGLAGDFSVASFSAT